MLIKNDCVSPNSGKELFGILKKIDHCTSIRTAEELLKNLHPQTGNPIDQVLKVALFSKYRIIFAVAYKRNSGIEIDKEGHKLFKVSIFDLIEQLKTREDLTPYSKLQLKVLDLLSQTTMIDKKTLTNEEVMINTFLINDLYEASINLEKVNSYSLSAGFRKLDDFKDANDDGKTNLSFVQNLINERSQTENFISQQIN